jgi:hypothetical protein
VSVILGRIKKNKTETDTKIDSNVNVNTKQKIKCPMCGKLQKDSDYYRATSPLYENNNNRMVFCKSCNVKVFDKYFKITNDLRIATYITCMKFDVPYSESEFCGMLKQVKNGSEQHPFRIYMTKLNSLGLFNNNMLDFEPEGLFKKDMNLDYTSNIKSEDKEDVNPSVDLKEIEKEIEITEEDLQVKEDVIRLIGYDPFAGYSKFDQKFLYNDLSPYLDEDTLDDNFKLSQIIQIVNNNNQIRKIDLIINNMSCDVKSLLANHGDIKSLTQTKKNIVDNTDKIAKENSISVKHRGDKTAGKSTLTYLMKNYRELGFEDAEQDYYDQKKANGMKLVADISNKSILEQLQFDENDINDMFFTQRQLIEQLNQKVLELEEENRQLYVKLSLPPEEKGE